MKIIIFYGNGEVSKREESLKLRKSFPKEAVTLVDFKIDGLERLKNLITSPSLFFSGPRLIVLDNIADKFDLEELQNNDQSLTLLVVGDDFKATSLLLTSAKKLKSTIKTFDLGEEVSVFPLLDSLLEKKSTSLLQAEKITENYSGIYLLTMIYYLLRRNLLPLPSATFVRNKIIQQKKDYQEEDFQKLYFLTLETEYKIKSGAVDESNGVFKVVSSFLN